MRFTRVNVGGSEMCVSDRGRPEPPPFEASTPYLLLLVPFCTRTFPRIPKSAVTGQRSEFVFGAKLSHRSDPHSKVTLRSIPSRPKSVDSGTASEGDLLGIKVPHSQRGWSRLESRIVVHAHRTVPNRLAHARSGKTERLCAVAS